MTPVISRCFWCARFAVCRFPARSEATCSPQCQKAMRKASYPAFDASARWAKFEAARAAKAAKEVA